MVLEKENSPNRTEIYLSNILRFGLICSITVILIGTWVLLWQLEDKVIDYSIFDGEPLNLKNFFSIWGSASDGDASSIIQLGILLMIATPVCRVALCIYFFFKEKDQLYVALSCFVFAVLIYSLLHR